MTHTPDPNNRLKEACNSVDVPAGLSASILGRIREEQDQLQTNARLRRAVQSEPVPPFLEARIRSQIRSIQPGRRWFTMLVPATAAAAIFAGLLIAYQLGHLRLSVTSQESYIASVSNRVGTLMRVGLGDHIHCAYFRKFPKNPPPIEQFVAKMGPQYAGLIPIIRSHVPDSYTLSLAHQCKYHGRKFVHLSLMDNSHLLSVVLTRKADGESFNTEGILPALVQSGIPMYQSNVQRFQMTAFETRDYLVYFVSDLPKQKNADLMLAMAPEMKDYLKKLEL